MGVAKGPCLCLHGGGCDFRDLDNMCTHSEYPDPNFKVKEIMEMWLTEVKPLLDSLESASFDSDVEEAEYINEIKERFELVITSAGG